ncbi:histone deacetylase family protein [Candidatus Micrarchaeota archaeon]|nr:histone deacetylase family protein [Candidatus Micrarchaeota archaeon]
MKIVYSERFLEHETGAGNPETPERLVAIVKYLKENNLPVIFDKPKEIADRDLYIVHDEEYIEKLKFLSDMQQGGGDNPFSMNTFKIAKLAAGGALKAAENSENGFSFALIRPPGHHASRNAFGGFCYLNNIAFTVASVIATNIKMAMIVDIDQHHGNGTQDIFYNDSRVFYLSFHQDPNTCFPWSSGFEKENNRHIKNVVLQPGIKDAEYLKTFQDNFPKYANEFKPQLIGVSVGFDTFYKDYSCGNAIDIQDSATYNKIGSMIQEQAEKIGARVFAVLEGGYYLDTLGQNFWSFCSAFL